MVVRDFPKRELSIGKLRGLQQCASVYGTFSILALDHRNNLRSALRPDAPQSVTTEEMIAFKRQIIQELACASSGVLLDPEIGAAQCVTAGTLPGSIGLIVALEMTGYTGSPNARSSQLLPGWTVAKAKRMGASAVKLLVYYHPDAPTAAEIEALVEQVASECVEHDMALILEPLSYSYRENSTRLNGAERQHVILETARRLIVPGVDVLKAEFPLDVAMNPDERTMAQACTELSAASAVPWILLSASVPYDVYVRQATIACQAGASGIAAGRAIWQESPMLDSGRRTEFLRKTAYARMAKLTGLCNALARPWSDFFAPAPIGDKWYEQY